MAFTPSQLTSGSFWTMGGYALQQMIRFGGNLLLTHLLLPEAFGLMSLVFVFIQGLEMFSDLGIGPSIIHHKRGDEKDYLKTAWTFQIARGLFIFVAASLFAYPLSLIYHQPQLFLIIPFIGLSSLLTGFNSTSLVSLNRHLRMKSLVLFDLVTQVMSLIFMAVWAYLSPTVWSLVFGNLFYAASRTVLSYMAFPTFRHMPHFEKEAQKEIWAYGKGVFLSSLFTFLAYQLDIILLGYLLPIATLGIFTLAFNIAKLPNELVKHLANKILFPLFSHYHRDDNKQIKLRFGKVRLFLALPFAALLIFLSFEGTDLIHFLYPQTFWDAGWMLEILVLGFMAAIFNSLSNSIYLATGQTLWMASLMGIQIAVLLTLILLGWHWHGQQGLITAIATVEYLMYPFHAWKLHQMNLWTPLIDIPFLAIGACLLATKFISLI